MNLNADSAKFIKSVESDYQLAAGAVAYEEEAKSRNLVVSARREPLISCSSEATGAAMAIAAYATNQSGEDSIESSKTQILIASEKYKFDIAFKLYIFN